MVCYQYGNQKNNIWELQKEQLRKQILYDKKHYYTYSNDYNSGAFAIVNEAEERAKEKAKNQDSWISPTGFDNLNKRVNWNKHPKKPDAAKLDELLYPYVKQAETTKASLLSDRDDDGKPVFFAGTKNLPFTFSDRSYFKTVFADSAEDVSKQEN